MTNNQKTLAAIEEAIEDYSEGIRQMNLPNGGSKATNTYCAVELPEMQMAKAALELARDEVKGGHYWQDIKTAPKDGTEIMVKCDGWNAPLGIKSRVDYQDIEITSYFKDGKWHSRFLIDIKPTHWKPLPDDTPMQRFMEKVGGE